jgi:transposase InsO family protein
MEKQESKMRFPAFPQPRRLRTITSYGIRILRARPERLHHESFQTIRQAKDETIDWLLWYNQTRMHSTLGYVSPIQFEQQWHRTTQAIAS